MNGNGKCSCVDRKGEVSLPQDAQMQRTVSGTRTKKNGKMEK
jgi:hypothetical protein